MVIEGASATDLDQPTLVRQSIERLQKLVERYRGEYQISGEGNGRCIAIHGEHGSGKTHALARAMTDLASQRDDLSPVRVIYVRVDSRDVLALYRKLMSQVPLPELRDLCADAQAAYARDEFAHSRGLTPSASREAIGDVDSDLEWVTKAFDASELQPTAVLNRQSDDLNRAGLGRQDFERVLPNLLNPDLVEDAYRWITGQALADVDLRRLGVTENIQDALKVRIGIQALLILSQKVARPFAILFDQTEAFVTADDGSLDLENVGILRAIVERVVGSSGLLGMAMREVTWTNLPLDLLQRFGPSEIYTAGLTVREATDLVKIYVSPWVEGEESTFPILAGGLREALRNSGGNIRQFLQLCSLLFTAAVPTEARIDSEFAKTVFCREASPVPDKEGLRNEFTELLTAAHVSFQAGYTIGEATVDFAVTDTVGRVRAFVVFTDALFGTEEVALARETLDLVKKAQNRSYPAEVVLIVGGYMSRELTSKLGSIYRVIVATAKTASQEMAMLVDELSMRASPAIATDMPALENRLLAIQSSLDMLETERDREAEALRQRASALADTQLAVRRSAELDETRRKWRAEEEKIARELRTARQERRQAELAELERLRARAVEDRRRITAIVAFFVTVFLVAFGAIWWASVFYYSNWIYGALLGLACGTLVAAAGYAAIYLPGPAHDLAGPVESIQELDRLAHAYIDRWRSPSRRLLRNRNPQFRYAATLMRGLRLGALSEALSAERSAIARRALVKLMIGEHGLDGAESVITSESGDAAMSVVLERLGDWFDSGEISKHRFSPEIRTLACFYGYPIIAHSLIDEFMRATQNEVGSDLTIDAAARQLAEAYVRDDDIILLRTVDSFSERDLRTAAARLSPFDAGRLGTFDWLVKIEDIDQMFLFFRKCLFYLGRGLENYLDT